MPSIRKTQPSADEVQGALTFLHEHPYGSADALDHLAQRRLEKACEVILVTVQPLLLKSCLRTGVDDDEAQALILKEVNKFMVRDAAAVPPVFHRVLRWLERACMNAVISHLRSASRMVRLEEALIAERHRDAEQDPDELSDEEKATAGPRKRPLELMIEDEPDDPSWLSMDLPAGVSEELRQQAVDLLPPSDIALLHLMYSQLESDRLESEDPRAFDRKPYRLCATKAAELLGRTANSVSVQWVTIQKKVHRTIGILRVRELLREGHSMLNIRMTLKELHWSDTDADKLTSQLGLAAGQARGGAQ